MMNRLFLWCLSFIKQFWWWQSVKQRHWFCTETSGGLFLGDAVLLEWSLRKTNRTISFMSIIDIQPWPCSQRVNRERAQRGTAPLPHWRSLWHWNGTQSSYWGLNQVTNSAGRQEHRQWDQSINQSMGSFEMSCVSPGEQTAAGAQHSLQSVQEVTHIPFDLMRSIY